MPITATIETLLTPNLTTAGDYLAALARGDDHESADVVVVPVSAGGGVAADPALAAVLGMTPDQVIAAGELTGKAGQSAQVIARVGLAIRRVLFLGVGDRSLGELRRAGAELGRMLRPGEVAVTAAVTGQPGELVQAFAEGILLGSYRYSQKSAADSESAEVSVRLLAAADGAAGPGPAGFDAGAEVSEQPGRPEPVSAAATVAAAVALARDLANTPSLVKSPQWLADAAVEVAAGAGLAVRVWTDTELAAAGFGGIVAVGSGSDRPPRLIELRHNPSAAGRPVVLIGKGITFDSGGLSLKPNDGMKAMKTDMAGGAAVIAVMSALARLNVPYPVTGLIAAAENMPSGAAYRPGDVITQYGGRTVEVLNTDAEGRLVLADALAYASAELKPDQIVDIATLTGAARVALGASHAALYSSSDELAAALLAAGLASGDRLWRMPLVDDYRPELDSPVADLTNVTRAADMPGSITAALFLREFAGTAPWAHLDIAAAARSGSDDGELTTGATGFGTRLLLRWLADRAP